MTANTGSGGDCGDLPEDPYISDGESRKRWRDRYVVRGFQTCHRYRPIVVFDAKVKMVGIPCGFVMFDGGLSWADAGIMQDYWVVSQLEF